MPAITNEQNAVTSKFFTEWWQTIVKPFYNLPDAEHDDEFWKDLCMKTSDLCDKYGKDDPRVVNMAMSFVAGLERLQKEHPDIAVHEYMMKDDILDALNNLFKAQKEVGNAMTELQNAFKRAHRVKLADSSLMVAKVLGDTDGKQA